MGFVALSETLLQKRMKYYIIAGEASGDLHGSNLMKALYQEDTAAEIRFWGGDLMQSVGGTLVKHYRSSTRTYSYVVALSVIECSQFMVCVHVCH